MIWWLLACNGPPSDSDLAGTEGGKVDAFFNNPGTDPTNMWDPDVVDVMVDLIDNTQVTLDLATMGFSNQALVDAVIAAYDRGVKVRFVGDASHIYNSGYQALYERHVPMTVGNSAHIMHDKFFVSDGRMVFAGTGNWEDSDLKRNWNNFLVMDDPDMAADFTAEFDQMFAGVFGNNKVEIDNGRVYTLGDTTVEVWFSPDEDAMGRIIELVNAAQQNVRFGIFAFTKDQLGSALADRHRELSPQSPTTDPTDPDYVGVGGVIDKSQLHSNGQYHEIYRLLDAGVPVREDGNDDEKLPGDYQAGGGRLHSKTMVIDPYGDDPTVITGSFNWSASATQSNDEFLLVLKGPRIAGMFDDYWNLLWDTGRTSGGDRMSTGAVQSQDVVINEVMWYGINSGDVDGTDEFVELRNRTDHDIDLSLWQIAGPTDFIAGLPPGSVIPANGTFLILDHVLQAYVDGAPQSAGTAFYDGDLVLNTFNDDRQARLYLKDGDLELYLRDPEGQEVDRAGDGGPAFVGGPSNDGTSRSMERNDDPGDGGVASSWHACTNSEGGSHVTDSYKAMVIATPGEANSPQ